jgi:hypothetical protein
MTGSYFSWLSIELNSDTITIIERPTPKIVKTRGGLFDAGQQVVHLHLSFQSDRCLPGTSKPEACNRSKTAFFQY